MVETPWTESQTRAIRTTGCGVLVSAGAGSGKTAVLAERCAFLVADARPACGVDDLLVMTFTEAAAAEMRERIGKALQRRLDADPANARLRQHLALLDSASISTIHAFCKRLLARHFAQAGLDPFTPLMDAADAALLRQETLDRACEKSGGRSDVQGQAFEQLLSAYGGPNEVGLLRPILSLNAFLESIPDPDEWTERALAAFQQAQPGVLSSEWVVLLGRSLLDELTEQIEMLDVELTNGLAAGDVLSPHLAALNEYHGALGEWILGARRAVHGNSPSAASLDEVISRIGGFTFPAVPRKTKAIKELPEPLFAAFEQACATLRDIRERMFKNRLCEAYGKFNCGDWAEGISRTAVHIQALLGVAGAFRNEYRKAKADLGVMDFSDLETRTLDLLRDESNGVARRLRERYAHVLVDEFQDINPVQAEIIRRVSRESQSDRPNNLFAVGDVKQSIYRFRLAEPELFTAKLLATQTRPQGESSKPADVVIDLVENFRSAEGVIEAINAVFERLMAPDLAGMAYDEHARLKCGRVARAAKFGGAPIELHILDQAASAGSDSEESDDDTGATEPSDAPDEAGAPAGPFEWERVEREAHLVGTRIRALAEQGAAYSDIVVLMRSMAHRGPLFVRTLARMGIPVFADVPGGFLEALEIRDMTALLSLLDNMQQDIPLAAVLRSPLFGEPLTDSQLVELRVFARHAPFHATVTAYAENGPEGALRERLRHLLTRLSHWRSRIRRHPLPDVIWEIYDATGYLAFVSALADGAQRRANLIGLHDRARQFGGFGRLGLYRFLRFIEDLADMGTDLEPGAVASTGLDVVRVMTIHRSKGLEFPIVFVTELGKKFNNADSVGPVLFDRRLGLGLEAVDEERRIIYPTLPHRLVSQRLKAASLAEELRVLYVALTRAREKLILVGTGRTDSIVPAEAPPGPLPLMQRRGAGSMLNWLVAAITARGREGIVYPDEPADDALRPPLFALHTCGADVMKDWRIDSPIRRDVSDRLARIARMEPVDVDASVPADDVAIRLVRRRLTATYPHDAMTRVPAVIAASELKRRWTRLADDEEPVTALLNAAFNRVRFAAPLFRAKARRLDPVERGTLTHAFLERVDFSRPCTIQDLRKQYAAFAERDPSAPSAGAIDLDAVAWFLKTPLGLRLRADGTRVHREWPFVMAAEPARYAPGLTATDPADQMLVRGIIDCLFDAGEGWEIIDYKTDPVSGAALQARAELYRGQLAIYARAVQGAWPSSVRRASLVFLSAQNIVEVPL